MKNVLLQQGFIVSEKSNNQHKMYNILILIYRVFFLVIKNFIQQAYTKLGKSDSKNF